MKIKSKKAVNVIYRCRVCGYVYDPSQGDPVRGISPGVDFLDLPAGWRCPICKYTKKEFREIKL